MGNRLRAYTCVLLPQSIPDCLVGFSASVGTRRTARVKTEKKKKKTPAPVICKDTLQHTQLHTRRKQTGRGGLTGKETCRQDREVVWGRDRQAETKTKTHVHNLVYIPRQHTTVIQA